MNIVKVGSHSIHSFFNLHTLSFSFIQLKCWFILS